MHTDRDDKHVGEKVPVEDLADALTEVCASYLRAKIATADNPDIYQVIIHAGARAITGAEPATTREPNDVSAETPDPRRSGNDVT